MLIYDAIRGLATCSDPGFAVFQLSFMLGKQEKGQFLYTSQGIVHPNGTGQNSNDVPLALFSAISNDVPALLTLCCCSACEAVFASLHIPRHFLRVARA